MAKWTELISLYFFHRKSKRHTRVIQFQDLNPAWKCPKSLFPPRLAVTGSSVPCLGVFSLVREEKQSGKGGKKTGHLLLLYFLSILQEDLQISTDLKNHNNSTG